MKRLALAMLSAPLLASCPGRDAVAPPERTAFYRIDPAQLPGFTDDDVDFLMHGSMSSEFIPESVLGALVVANPDLFPGGGFSAYGVTAEPGDDLPIGVTRRTVAHLGGQRSIGINCAVCHVAELREAPDAPPRRVVGPPSHLSVYDFGGAVAVALARALEPPGMAAFLRAYGGAALGPEIERQGAGISAALAADRFASKGLAPGEIHDVLPADLEPDPKDLPKSVRTLLRLFRNIRICLGVPEQLPPPLPTLPGPGRSDAFAVLALALFQFPSKFDAPAKYGVVWNLEDRRWVHWDGNSQHPLTRNLQASLGLGAPLAQKGRTTDLALVKRMTDLTQRIRAPRYPWPVDGPREARGRALYAKHCASCHDASEDKRLFAVEEVGTDPNRARFFDARQLMEHGKYMASLEIAGYRAPADAYRTTGRYWAADLAGAWARSPYLHNGSVRTMADLLTPPSERPRTWRRGSKVYDRATLGYTDGGAFLFDSSLSGNSNAGHAYGTSLAPEEKRDLLEHLKAR